MNTMTRDTDGVLLIDVATVANKLSLSERSVWEYAKTGRMPGPRHVGRRRLWSVSEIEQWIAAGCPAAA